MSLALKILLLLFGIFLIVFLLNFFVFENGSAPEDKAGNKGQVKIIIDSPRIEDRLSRSVWSLFTAQFVVLQNRNIFKGILF